MHAVPGQFQRSSGSVRAMGNPRSAAPVLPGSDSVNAAMVALGTWPHAHAGGPESRVGSRSVLWLQSTIGNAAVRDLMAQRQTTVARAKRRRRRAAGKAPGLGLGQRDLGDVGLFIDWFPTSYGRVNSARTMPAKPAFGSSTITRLEASLRAALEQVFTGRDGSPDAFWAAWPSVRRGLFEVADWGAGHGVDKGMVATYRMAVRALEARFVRWWAQRRAESRADAMDVGNPDAAYEAAVAAALPRYARRVLELIEAQIQADAKERGAKRELQRGGLDVASETIGQKGEGSSVPANGSTSRGATGGAAAVDSVRSAYAFYTLLAEGGEMHEQLARLKAAKLLPQTATSLQMVQTVITSTATVLEFKTRLVMAAGAKAGERWAAVAGSFKSIEQAKQFESFSKAFGVLAGAAGVVASSISLIHAIRSGKSRDIAEASIGLASSGATLAMAIGGAGAAITTGVGGVFFMFGAIVSMTFDLAEILGQLDRDSRARGALRMVEDARAAAHVGRLMAAAWDEAQQRKVSALDAGPDSAAATAVAELEALAYRYAREMVPLMRRVLVHLQHWADDSDLRIRRATRAIRKLDFRVEIDSIWEFTDLCKVAFRAVDAVTRIVIKDAGGLPPTGPQF
jgi:hypothetical protein